MANPSPLQPTGWTNWTKCCLRQKDKNEQLKSPQTCYKSDNDGYNRIATNVPLFHAIHDLPIVLDPGRLDEGGEIEETLTRNKAQYHQSCRLLFNDTKLLKQEREKYMQTAVLRMKEEASSSQDVAMKNENLSASYVKKSSSICPETSHDNAS